MNNLINKKMSLFTQIWKAEQYFGSEFTAHHLNTRSVYRLKDNTDIAINHSAKYVENGTIDEFAVTLTKVTAYHTSGNVLSSETKTLGVFDNWLDAYYTALGVNQQSKVSSN